MRGCALVPAVRRSGSSVRTSSCKYQPAFSSSHLFLADALAGSESTAKALTDEFLAPFANPALWSALCHAQTPPFVQIDGPGFGFAQPGVRRAAWSLLQTMLRSCKGEHPPLKIKSVKPQGPSSFGSRHSRTGTRPERCRSAIRLG